MFLLSAVAARPYRRVRYNALPAFDRSVSKRKTGEASTVSGGDTAGDVDDEGASGVVRAAHRADRASGPGRQRCTFPPGIPAR